MNNCKICNQKFKSQKSLVSHFNLKHIMTSKQYYDKFLLKEKENECEVCGKETSYRNINTGYLKNCSIECRNKNKNIKRNYWQGKKQKRSTIEKRIKNTNQSLKELSRKKTMVLKYGKDNPAKIKTFTDKISKKLIGRKLKRTDSWQKNIIISKKKNGSINHTQTTKKKISSSLIKMYSSNLDREKYISESTNHLSGWYNGIYFRSSLELSFLHKNKDKKHESCENKKYGIEYVFEERKKMYYPDYTDFEFVYELKPSSLLNLEINKLKIEVAQKKYGDKFVVITEKDCPYISKKEIEILIKNKIVLLTKKSETTLSNYKKK